MIAAVAIPRRPLLRDREVELASALGSCPTLCVWRERLPTIRVVRARRCIRAGVLDRQTWWDVRLEAEDGWHAEGELVDVEPLIDVDAIVAELGRAERVVASRARITRTIRWLVWDEIWLARDRLQTRLMEAQWVEVE